MNMPKSHIKKYKTNAYVKHFYTFPIKKHRPYENVSLSKMKNVIEKFVH